MNCAEKILEPTLIFHFVSQVTIYFRFQKSLTQERFMSNLEFRYQIIVSYIKFRKGSAKFMKLIALFKMFLCKQIIANVEVSTWLDALVKRMS